MDENHDDQSQIIIGDLQATILALRDRLEDAAFETKKAEQRATLNCRRDTATEEYSSFQP